MNKARIKEEAEHFFEWPTNRRDHVTLTSCLIFAEVIAGMAVDAEREACAQVCVDAIGSIRGFGTEDAKQTGINVCSNLAKAIRARGE
jgi:hypothetical protein